MNALRQKSFHPIARIGCPRKVRRRAMPFIVNSSGEEQVRHALLPAFEADDHEIASAVVKAMHDASCEWPSLGRRSTIKKLKGGAMQSRSQIDDALRQATDASESPGVVAMAATPDEVIYQGTSGKRDLSKDDAMTADSVFWIASMTKAITAASAMQL